MVKKKTIKPNIIKRVWDKGEVVLYYECIHCGATHKTKIPNWEKVLCGSCKRYQREYKRYGKGRRYKEYTRICKICGKAYKTTARKSVKHCPFCAKHLNTGFLRFVDRQDNINFKIYMKETKLKIWNPMKYIKGNLELLPLSISNRA